MKYLLPSREAKKVAAAHGLEVDTGAQQPVGNFGLYGTGSSRITKRRMRRPDGPATVFDYELRIDRGDEESTIDTKKFTGALVSLPIDAPHTVLRRESVLNAVSGWFGGATDITIGVPELDSRYMIQSSADDFVRLANREN